MLDLGLDLGKRTSHVCVRRPDGSFLERRVATTREGLATFFAPHGTCRILLESSTSSEWVARYLESLGHQVIVADPNFGPMYAQRSKKVKTDKRDARALQAALELNAYKPAHRCSDEQRHRRREITVRASLVETRTREYSSSEKVVKGSLTKVGDPRVRALLVQAAWAFLQSKDPRAHDLQEWTLQIAARRGRQKAIVALARKLAGICYAIWRDSAEFALPSHLTIQRSRARAAA